MYASYTLSDWQRQYDDAAPLELSMAYLPNISSVIDAFAKSYYSLLLSDFNITRETGLTNAFASTEGIHYLQSINSTETADDASNSLATRTTSMAPSLKSTMRNLQISPNHCSLLNTLLWICSTSAPFHKRIALSSLSSPLSLQTWSS